MNQILWFALAAVLCVGASDASAFTMREQKFINGQMKYFQRGTKRIFERHCKTKIPMQIDWKSFRGQIQRRFARKLFKSPYSYCQAPLATLYGHCRDGFRSAIQQQVTRYTCHFGGRGGTKVSLQNGHLEFWVDWKKSNIGKYLKHRIGRLVSAGNKSGFTMREQKFINGQMKYFQRGTKRIFERYCKTKIPMQIDWKSFRGQIQRRFARKLFKSPYSYCQAPLATLYGYCREGFRGRIQSKVRRYVCKFGGRGRTRVSLRRGTLTFWVDWKKSNIGKYLKRKLGGLL